MASVSPNHFYSEEPENKCPECLYMEIRGVPVEAEVKGWLARLRQKMIRSEAIDLFLLINFSEQWESYPLGQVKFGLQGGELRLTITNGKIPHDLRFLQKSLDTEILMERQVQQEEEAKRQAEGSLGSDSKGSFKATSEKRDKSNFSDKFTLNMAQISSKGLKEKPIWVFENKTGEKALRGYLDTSLAQMLVNDIPCQIEAKFVVAADEVRITGLANIFADDIHKNRWNAFELGVAELWLKRLKQSHLSRQVLHYE